MNKISTNVTTKPKVQRLSKRAAEVLSAYRQSIYKSTGEIPSINSAINTLVVIGANAAQKETVQE